MKELRSESIRLRLTEAERKNIAAYCAARRIESGAEFIRGAIAEKLAAEAEDASLIAESVQSVRESIQELDRKVEILFKFQKFYARYDMAYLPDISESMRPAAAKKAVRLFDYFYRAFIEEGLRKDSPSMFESLLADFFEEK